MCLTINRKYHGLVHTQKGEKFYPIKTNRPLLVYKILEELDNGFQTPFQYCPIEFTNGKKTLKGFDFPKSKFYKDKTVHCGVHSWASKTVAEQECLYGRAQQWAFDTYKAVVPANTLFYVGEDGDVVSTRLTIFETDEDFEAYKKNHKNIEEFRMAIESLAR